MKRRRTRRFLLLAIILFISIGFAVISTNLSINGLFNFTPNTWSIKLKNVVVDENSVTTTLPTINQDENSVTFSAELNKPGDFYSFNIDVLNESTIDAMLGSITVNGITSEYSDYLSCVVTYSNGVTPNPNDILYKTARVTLNVKLLYKDIETSQIPEDVLNPTITLTINYRQANKNAVLVSDTNHWNFDYIGDSQTFSPIKTGNYKIELWGGGGHSCNDVLAAGGYVSGKIDLATINNIYVYVGSKYAEEENITLFNAGKADAGGYLGAGATDIRLVNGNWDSFDSLKSRIIVAGGAGIAFYDQNDVICSNGGNAGGLIGYYAGGTYGATQISSSSPEKYVSPGATFGKAYGGCTGWNGYFAAGGAWCSHGSGGGSSFISGHAGCVAIDETSTEDNIIFKTDTNNVACNSDTSSTYNSLGYNTDSKCSIHYSNKVFTNTIMIDGAGYQWTTEKGNEVVGMPNKNGMGTVTGNTGNGFAKITLIG